MKIAVLLTCHNRKLITLSCLDALFENVLPDDCLLEIFMVDDGSTDGTEQAVRERYSQVVILKGDGNLYWNRGMHLAFSVAMKAGFDYYLWLNDDTILFPLAIKKLLRAQLSDCSAVIVVGAICDPASGEFSYGGARQIAPVLRPFLCEYVLPNGRAQRLDVMNGNMVLIPDTVARKLGNIDPVFEHAMGDTDYAMRAVKLGVKIFITGEYVGSCSRNDIKGTYRDKSISLRARLIQLFSRKGLPFRSWFIMCRRHGGALWPIHFIWGYMKIILGRS